MSTKTNLERFSDNFLEDNTFDELLEYFDIVPIDALEVLFENGLIDEELVEEYLDDGGVQRDLFRD